jgi:antitoxin HicB
MVEFVDLHRVATDGKDLREAMEEAMDALGSDLSIRSSRREEIPTPSSAKRGERLVPVHLWLAPKLALYLAMREQRVNNSDLARRLGLHERVIRRMLDPKHATKAEKIQAALAVLGKQMTVEVRDAAQGRARILTVRAAHESFAKPTAERRSRPYPYNLGCSARISSACARALVI